MYTGSAPLLFSGLDQYISYIKDILVGLHFTICLFCLRHHIQMYLVIKSNSDWITLQNDLDKLMSLPGLLPKIGLKYFEIELFRSMSHLLFFWFQICVVGRSFTKCISKSLPWHLPKLEFKFLGYWPVWPWELLSLCIHFCLSAIHKLLSLSTETTWPNGTKLSRDSSWEEIIQICLNEVD